MFLNITLNVVESDKTQVETDRQCVFLILTMFVSWTLCKNLLSVKF